MKKETAKKSLKWHKLFLLGLIILSKLTVKEVCAVEYKTGDVGLTVSGAMTMGTSLRTNSRNDGLYPSSNGAVIGAGGSAVSGANQDDGNLNFDKYDRISTVAKGILGAEVKYSFLKAFVRGKAWYDYTLSEENRPWGNSPNSYAADSPLGDAGFSDRSKFSGVALMEAYLEGNLKPAEIPVDVRVGNQLIPWGNSVAIPGGLSVINPVDVPAARRPGALPEETKIPFTAAFTRIGITDKLKVEGYYQILWQQSEIDPCGTFFSTNDYIGQGCNKVFLGAGSDRSRMTTGSYIKKAGTPEVSNSGQYGVGLTYKAEPISTDFGIYFSQFHSRTPVASVIKTSRTTAPFIPNDPGGLNVQYFAEFPEDVQMYGLNFKSIVKGTTVYGEFTYRPNQPFTLNASDLLNAFASNTASSQLRSAATATQLGGNYSGYDRREVSQMQLGIVQKFNNIIGADSGSFGTEVGLKHVFDLPDVQTRRYGRSDVFGTGPVNGVCSATASSEQCSNDGYVTETAWGYRLNANLNYKDIIKGIDLTPSLRFGHDVSGWSYDNVFIEGRMTLNMALRANMYKNYMAEISYNPTWGGTYNNAKDRGNMSMFAGFKF